MKNLDRISGIVLLVFGTAILWSSLTLPIGTFRTPGGGLFPLIASTILLILSAILTFQAFFSKKGREAEAAPFFPEKGTLRRILLGFTSLTGYRCLLPVIGFGPSTGLFLLFLSKFLGNYGWKVSLLYSLLSAILFYYLFEVWLRIPMPRPLLRF